MGMAKRRELPLGPTEERIRLAKLKMRRVVDHLITLVALHENNRLIVYSPTLSDQIPRSHAANPFNLFQRSVHSFEIIRLCALWDGNDPAKENIPTVVQLIDNPEIVDALEVETRDQWGRIGTSMLNPDPDPGSAEADRRRHQC
jgi:hypothetical protein